MRTALMVAMLVAAAAPAGAQERLADRLRKGIVEEETTQNLDKAIKTYQAIVAQYDEDRKTAGTALFRLAECSRKAGRREQAIAAYQRVLREFTDQAALVESSRQQLATTFGVTDTWPSRASQEQQRAEIERQRMLLAEVAKAAGAKEQQRAEIERQRIDADLQRALRERVGGSPEETKIELEALEKQLADLRKKVEVGLMAPQEVRNLETEYLMLKQRYQQQLVEREARMRNEREAQALNQRLIQSVQAEMELVRQQIQAMEKKVGGGVVSAQDAELIRLKRDLLALQRKLDELRAGLKR